MLVGLDVKEDYNFFFIWNDLDVVKVGRMVTLLIKMCGGVSVLYFFCNIRKLVDSENEWTVCIPIGKAWVSPSGKRRLIWELRVLLLLPEYVHKTLGFCYNKSYENKNVSK